MKKEEIVIQKSGESRIVFTENKDGCEVEFITVNGDGWTFSLDEEDMATVKYFMERVNMGKLIKRGL